MELIVILVFIFSNTSSPSLLSVDLIIFRNALSNDMYWALFCSSVFLNAWRHSHFTSANCVVISFDVPSYLNTKVEQESPPAWTQEAFRPPCIKYSSAVPSGGRGYPHLVLARGYSHPDLTRGPPPLPSGPDGGTPLSGPDGPPGIEIWDMGSGTWVPPSPQKGLGTSGWKYYGVEIGYHLPKCEQTPVKTVPSPFLRNTGGKNKPYQHKKVEILIQLTLTFICVSNNFRQTG